MAKPTFSKKDESGDEANATKAPGEGRGRVRKGPWTPVEDAILVEYVKKHGEGNWNSVQKNSGLSRCGKSCRLRWANHLRPNLKKGAFSPEEEHIIIDLHSKLGNKWARMAAQLPGRTDNEIKNFWNTRTKRRQRAGLPIYPPEVHAEATAYHLQQQFRYLTHQQQEQQHQQQQKQQPHSSASFSLLLSSCYPKKLNEPNQTLHSSTNPLQNQPDNSANCYINPSQQQFNFSNENSGKNGNLALPLSPYGSSSSTLLNNNHSFPPGSGSGATDSRDYQSFGDHHGFIAGSPYEQPFPFVPGYTTENSSSHTPTPASSYTSGVDGINVGASSMVNHNNNNNNEFYEVAPLSPQGNSGLLDALVMEAQVLSHNNKSKSEEDYSNGKLCCKRKNMEYAEDGGTVPVVSAMKKKSRNIGNESQRDDGTSSSQLSKGKKVIGEDPVEEMNAMDDDLFSLLNNYHSEMPMPEWYRRGESQSLGLENQPNALQSDPTTDQEYAWTLGTCWNNMPGIC